MAYLFYCHCHHYHHPEVDYLREHSSEVCFPLEDNVYQHDDSQIINVGRTIICTPSMADENRFAIWEFVVFGIAPPKFFVLCTANCISTVRFISCWHVPSGKSTSILVLGALDREPKMMPEINSCNAMISFSASGPEGIRFVSA
jgi:hypothetical protein